MTYREARFEERCVACERPAVTRCARRGDPGCDRHLFGDEQVCEPCEAAYQRGRDRRSVPETAIALIAFYLISLGVHALTRSVAASGGLALAATLAWIAIRHYREQARRRRYPDERRPAAGGRRREIVAWSLAAAGVGLAGLALGWRWSQPRDPGRGHAPALTAAQRDQLAGAIARSRVAIEAHDRPWRAAIAAVDPTAVPAGAPGCEAMPWAPRALAEPPRSWSGFRLHGARGASIATPFPVGITGASDPIPAHSAGARDRLHDLAEQLAGLDDLSLQSFETRLERVSRATLYRFDVLLAVDDAGLAARAWLFDRDEGRVVCAGVVRASGATDRDGDRLIELIRAIPAGARAAR